MKEPASVKGSTSYANLKDQQNYGKYFEALTYQNNLTVLNSPPHLSDYKITKRFDKVFNAIPKLSEHVIEILTPEQRNVANQIIDETQALLFIDTYELLADYNLEKKVNLKLLETYTDVIKSTVQLFIDLNSSRNNKLHERKLKDFKDFILFKLDDDWWAAERLSKIKQTLLKLIVKFSIWLAKHNKAQAATATESGLERGIDWSAKVLGKKPRVLNYALKQMGFFSVKEDVISTLQIMKKALAAKTYVTSLATADNDLNRVSHKK